MTGATGSDILLAAAVTALAVLAWPTRLGCHLDGLAPAGSAPGSLGRREARGPIGLTLGDVATTLTMLSLAVRGGAPVIEALDRVARVSADPARAHLSTVSAALRWGLTGTDAWACVPEAWAPAARALTLAVHAGVPPGGLLADAAAQVRADDTSRADEAAARLGVRLVLPLGLAFLPAFGLTSVVPVVVAVASQFLSG